jgi:4-hydroxybenzoate polyprenyltransferase
VSRLSSPHLRIARIDHWPKNAIVPLGALVAVLVDPAAANSGSLPPLALAFLGACLASSSNYTLNELLDAASDRQHPVKRSRAAASGDVAPAAALIQWAALGAAGLLLGAAAHPHVALALSAFWAAAVVYNVPPIRTKDVPHLDLLTESLNNPLRLLIGWFAVVHARFPPLSLLMAVWMGGAFFMAAKRFAEYRQIGDPAVAARYRRSFAWYTEERLLLEMFFHGVAAALFAGVFIVRWRLELILGIPLAAALFTWYLRLALRRGAGANPDHLYRDPGFLTFAAASLLVFVVLMFVHVPDLYELFNVEPARSVPLWTVGGPAAEGGP